MFLIRITANKNTIFSKLIRCYIYLFKRKYGIDMHPDTKIGPGLALSHAYNITINPGAIIGKNVFIGINSTVVGKIHIGDNVLIAPNSFVNMDIPSNSIVLGNPCKVIPKTDATKGYIGFLV